MASIESVGNIPTDERLVAAYAAANDLQTRLDNLKNNADAAIATNELSELDELYPYFGKQVYAAGNGLLPIFNDEGAIVGEGYGHSEGNYGTHDGFAIMCVFEDDESPSSYKLMHQILVSDVESQPLQTVEQYTRVFQYYDLNSSILPIAEIDTFLASHNYEIEDPQQQLEAISLHSRRFVNTIRSTKFRRMSKTSQQRTVEALLDEADDAARIRDMRIVAEPLIAYTPELISENIRRFTVVRLEEIIGGICLGLDTLETGFMRHKAIRRDSDLASRDAGLCVVVDPDDRTRSDLALGESQVLFIPTYNQDFDNTLLSVAE